MVRLIALLVWLAGVAMATPAFAHAVLLATQPADRAVIAEAPDQIVLRFNEPVRPVAIQVLDRAGARVAGEAVAAINEELRIALPRSLADGMYVVSYRVISADAHPVSGSFLFAIGAAPETWSDGAAKQKPPVHWPALASIDRAVFLAAAMIAGGGVLFLLLFRRHDPAACSALRPIVQATALLGVISAILTVGLQGALIAGAGSGALFDLEVWRLGATSTRGTACAVAILGLVLLALATTPKRRALAIAGIVALIASFPLSGHAATAMPRVVAISALLLHIAAAAFWLGAFVPLLQALNQPDAAKTLRRFSARAMIVVPALLAMGVILAVFQVEQVGALLTTNYGITLVLKIAGVLALLAIAVVNRVVLTPRLAKQQDAVGWLRHTIQAELALGFIILLLTAILSQTIPPRSLVHADHSHDLHRVEGYAVVVFDRGRMAVIEVEPARTGRNTIALHLTDRAGEPVTVQGVEAEITNPDAGIAPLRRKLSAGEPGRYSYTGPEFTLAGSWRLRVDVLINDFEKIVLESEVVIRQ